jgi:hypothetical protein
MTPPSHSAHPKAPMATQSSRMKIKCSYFSVSSSKHEYEGAFENIRNGILRNADHISQLRRFSDRTSCPAPSVASQSLLCLASPFAKSPLSLSRGNRRPDITFAERLTDCGASCWAMGGTVVSGCKTEDALDSPCVAKHKATTHATNQIRAGLASFCVGWRLCFRCTAAPQPPSPLASTQA